jgi:hypothetical protein
MTDSRQSIYLVAWPGVLILGGVGLSQLISALLTGLPLENRSVATIAIIANIARGCSFIHYIPSTRISSVEHDFSLTTFAAEYSSDS